MTFGRLVDLTRFRGHLTLYCWKEIACPTAPTARLRRGGCTPQILRPDRSGSAADVTGGVPGRWWHPRPHVARFVSRSPHRLRTVAAGDARARPRTAVIRHVLLLAWLQTLDRGRVALMGIGDDSDVFKNVTHEERCSEQGSGTRRKRPAWPLPEGGSQSPHSSLAMLAIREHALTACLSNPAAPQEDPGGRGAVRRSGRCER